MVRPIDIQSLFVRSLDIERMQQVMQQAQMIQQQQIAQQNAVWLAERLAQVETMRQGEHSAPTADTQPTGKENRTMSIGERRRRRHRFSGVSKEENPSPKEATKEGTHIDFLI